GGTRAVPPPLGAPRLREPAQHIEGRAGLVFRGKGRGVDPPHDVRLLADRRRHTAAIAIATVRHNDLARVPPVPRQVFPATAVRDVYLVHPAGQEVVGQMQPPVVPVPPGWPRGLASTNTRRPTG